MERTVGVHIVIVPSVNMLELVNYNTGEGGRWGVATSSYDHYETLKAQVDATPTFEPGSVIMMDYDKDSIHSPFFVTAEEAIAWGLKNFPHLTKVDLADARGHVWGSRLLSPKAINREWLYYAGGAEGYPVVDKPDWVEPLRKANEDPVSGKFLRQGLK